MLSKALNPHHLGRLTPRVHFLTRLWYFTFLYPLINHGLKTIVSGHVSFALSPRHGRIKPSGLTAKIFKALRSLNEPEVQIH